jgi:hypothetical protein
MSRRIVPRHPIARNQRVDHFLYATATGFLQSSTFLMEKSLMSDALDKTCTGTAHDDTSLALYLQERGYQIIQLPDVLGSFDDTPRTDRRSFDPDYIQEHMRWFHSHATDWPSSSKNGYMIKDVARRYINLGQKREAFLCLFRHFHPGVEIELYLRTFVAILAGGSPLRWIR